MGEEWNVLLALLIVPCWEVVRIGSGRELVSAVQLGVLVELVDLEVLVGADCSAILRLRSAGRLRCCGCHYCQQSIQRARIQSTKVRLLQKTRGQ